MNVRDAIFQLLRDRAVTHMFGNPGSTEMSMLAGLPESLKYVLCLHESVAVGAAAGYSLLSGRPSIVNVHAFPGLCNSMGAMASAKANKAPVVVTAGQQDTRHLRHEPLLSGPLAEVAAPVVKWSHQPVRAEDVPMALERAFRIALTAPMGPTFLSLPMDFLEQPASPVVPTDPVQAGGLAPGAAAVLVEQLRSAEAPALVTGRGIEAANAWDSTVRLAEALDLDVYADPFASQFGFPTDHQQFRGPLPPHAGQIRAVLEKHDFVLVVGAPVFVVYPYSPEHFVPQGTKLVLISDDPNDVARLEGGTSYLAGLGYALDELAGLALANVSNLTRSDHATGAGYVSLRSNGGIDLSAACDSIARHRDPDGIVMDESISAGATVRWHIRISAPQSYARTSNGILGFALPASIGAQLAHSDRQVLVVIGDGTAMYTPQALWTLAQQRLPVKIAVLNNGGYKILEDFHASTSPQLGPPPDLSLPGLDLVTLASSLGVASSRVQKYEELDGAIADAFASSGPHLIDIRLEPQMRMSLLDHSAE